MNRDAGRNMDYDLAPLEGLSEARTVDDDWTGLSDPSERRKRQNRLNQRAWRRRKAAQKEAAEKREQSERPLRHVKIAGMPSPGSPCSSNSGASIKQIEEFVTPQERRMSCASDLQLKPFSYWEERKARMDAESQSAYPSGLSHHASTHQSYLLDKLKEKLKDKANVYFEKKERLIPPMIPYLIADEQDDGSIPTFFFPISADHQLLVLVQFNVLRGVLTNMNILNILARLPSECGRAFNLKNLPPPPDSIPPSLQPTSLQKTIPHDPWIDVMPWPAMRDNALLIQDKLDDDALCVDVVGGLYEGLDNTESEGLIVWGEPWSENGWEVSGGFAKKWGCLLAGCDVLIESTNRFREARGEERLVVEI